MGFAHRRLEASSMASVSFVAQSPTMGALHVVEAVVLLLLTLATLLAME
jgi:hypothetical protein